MIKTKKLELLTKEKRCSNWILQAHKKLLRRRDQFTSWMIGTRNGKLQQNRFKLDVSKNLTAQAPELVAWCCCVTCLIEGPHKHGKEICQDPKSCNWSCTRARVGLGSQLIFSMTVWLTSSLKTNILWNIMYLVLWPSSWRKLPCEILQEVSFRYLCVWFETLMDFITGRIECYTQQNCLFKH